MNVSPKGRELSKVKDGILIISGKEEGERKMERLALPGHFHSCLIMCPPLATREAERLSTSVGTMNSQGLFTGRVEENTWQQSTVSTRVVFLNWLGLISIAEIVLEEFACLLMPPRRKIPPIVEYIEKEWSTPTKFMIGH